MKLTTAIAGAVLACAVSASAQTFQVKIVNRQDSEDQYDYAAVYNNVAVGKSFSVHGATFTLQLPDGRLAVVNCESKFAEHMAGRVGNRRSCRMPLVDDIQVDFKGDKAKLIWPVSLDGKKFESETYTILAVLEKEKQSGSNNVNATTQADTSSSIAPAQQDDAAAERWAADTFCSRKAAEQGDAKAQSSLADCYDIGIDIPQDYAQAAYWYRKAADQGYTDAESSLGTMYDTGQGVPQDYAQAAVWWRKAAEQGDANSQFSLSGLYYLGQGVPQDDAEAVAWLQKAADQGDEGAKTLLPLLKEEIAFAASSSGGDMTGNQTRTTLSPQAIAKRASESTVWIVSTDRNRKSVILGSGFAIEANLIVTNSHVFSAGGLGLVRKVGSDQPLPIKQVVLRDRQDDIVLLYVPGLNLSPLPIDSSEPVIGDTVFAMGNPEGMEGTFSEGIVSALRDSNGFHLIQITAPISHGSSGGPVFNIYGEVIGISTSTLRLGQNLNFAVPASEIDVLLKRARSIEAPSSSSADTGQRN